MKQIAMLLRSAMVSRERSFMALQPHTTNAPSVGSEAAQLSTVYAEGMVAGVIGAATIAIGFFLLDLYHGRPFHTPNVLGAALSLSAAVADPASAPLSIELVLFYTWVHGLVFCAIGGAAAKLLSLAERDLDVGFGILLLFVIFMFGFVAVAMIFAEPVLRALTVPAILAGNLLAAGAMTAYFWRRHPKLKIAP